MPTLCVGVQYCTFRIDKIVWYIAVGIVPESKAQDSTGGAHEIGYELSQEGSYWARSDMGNRKAHFDVEYHHRDEITVSEARKKKNKTLNVCCVGKIGSRTKHRRILQERPRGGEASTNFPRVVSVRVRCDAARMCSDDRGDAVEEIDQNLWEKFHDESWVLTSFLFLRVARFLGADFAGDGVFVPLGCCSSSSMFWSLSS